MKIFDEVEDIEGKFNGLISNIYENFITFTDDEEINYNYRDFEIRKCNYLNFEQKEKIKKIIYKNKNKSNIKLKSIMVIDFEKFKRFLLLCYILILIILLFIFNYKKLKKILDI